MKLDGDASGLDNEGTLTLTFVKATEIEPSLPYIIKWDKDDEHPTIDDPVFENVSVTSQVPFAVEFGGCKFVGQYDMFPINDANRFTIIMLGAENKIGYSAEPRDLHPFRAHFEVPLSLAVKGYSISFGKAGEATGILNTPAQPQTLPADGNYSTIDGRRLPAKPTAKGVYIHGGRKVVIK